MKQLFYLLVIVLMTTDMVMGQSTQYRQYQGINAQGLYIYGSATNFPDSLVADDYGPRQKDASTPYDWHGGIDYNAPTAGGNNDGEDKGDLILAVEKGKVSSSSAVNIPTNGFKWITVAGTHNIVYEHIFINGSIGGDGLTVGGCIVKHIDSTGFNRNNRDNWAIIFQINGEYNAIGPINGSKVKFKDELGTFRTLTVYDTVAQGAPVAPLGNSGEKYPFHAHIQGMSALYANGNVIQVGLSEGDKYAKNPLEYVSHPSPTFGFALSQQGLTSGISPVYPGNSLTPLLARVSLIGEADGKRYKNSIMDIERVEFKVKHTFFTDWINIRGLKNDRIQFGGRNPNALKPSQLRTQGVGDWDRTGVVPHAYWNHNYDEFYFANFYVRIHKNDPMNGTGLFALYPWDARYIDGDYEMKVAIANVNNIDPDNWSAGTSFKIDNFKPFIRSVGIYSGSGGVNDEQIYYREWTSQNAPAGKLRLAGIPPRNPASLLNQLVTIYAIASEPMRTVKAKLPPFANNLVAGTAVPGSDSTVWQFQFSTVNFTEDVCYTLVFKGEDLYGNAAGQGNQLLDLPRPYTCNTGSGLTFAVPFRTGADDWSTSPAQDSDAVHKFRVGECGMLAESNGPPCFTSNEVTYDVTSSAPGVETGSIDFTIQGSTSGMSFTWTNEEGEVISHDKNLREVRAGLYCVEIKYECCAFYDCIEVPECALNVVASATYSSSFAPTGSATLTIGNGMEPYQVHWDNGATTAEVTGLAAGNYAFTVTDAYHCGVATGSATVPACTGVQLDVDAVVLSACHGENGNIQLNRLNATGGVAPYTYYWTDDTGEPLDEPTDIAPGIYCLIATDANGCTGIKCFNVGQSSFSTNDIYIKVYALSN